MKICPDEQLTEEFEGKTYDAVILPGGLAGSEALAKVSFCLYIIVRHINFALHISPSSEQSEFSERKKNLKNAKINTQANT